MKTKPIYKGMFMNIKDTNSVLVVRSNEVQKQLDGAKDFPNSFWPGLLNELSNVEPEDLSNINKQQCMFLAGLTFVDFNKFENMIKGLSSFRRRALESAASKNSFGFAAKRSSTFKRSMVNLEDCICEILDGIMHDENKRSHKEAIIKVAKDKVFKAKPILVDINF